MSSAPKGCSAAASLSSVKKRQQNEEGEEGRKTKRQKTIESTLSLSTLPEEILTHILGFAKPKVAYKHWEWADTFGLTCKVFLKIARELAPKSLELGDFYTYSPPSRPRTARSHGRPGWRTWVEGVDLRNNILLDLCTSSWKGANLLELHVSSGSILSMHRNDWQQDEVILANLKRLLTTPNAFPRLTWLDISIMSDYVYDYQLVDATLLASLPSMLPSLTRLCLAGCFKETWNEVSPAQLKLFAEGLQSTLTSFSFGNVHWMSDDHVAAFLPVIGRYLTRLELINCSVFHSDEEDDDYETHEQLSDATMAVIARECRRLESLSITDTTITSTGLAQVLEANTGIRTLDLSGLNRNPGLLGAPGVIATHAPRLAKLRVYWDGTWLDDEGIITVVDAQMKASKGHGLALQMLGIDSQDKVTNRGLSYALGRGLATIEARDTHPRYHCTQKFKVAQLATKFPLARFIQPAYPNFVDGSMYDSRYPEWYCSP